MSHSPGPWKADCVGIWEYNDRPEDMYEVNNGRTRIAEYVAPDDARLIAAAPDLLSLAVRVEEYLAIGFSNEYDHAILEQARAVIAKATGEQP